MKKPYRTLSIASMVLLVVAAVLVSSIHAQQAASVKMAASEEEISGGKVLALEVKLDKPLPPETLVIARVRPESVSQLLVLQSATPDDPSRTTVTVRTTLPNVVVPGKWTLLDVFIVLPGSNIWQPLGRNDLSFDVKGKPFPIPDKAIVSVAK
jgi:hypothetical protein